MAWTDGCLYTSLSIPSSRLPAGTVAERASSEGILFSFPLTRVLILKRSHRDNKISIKVLSSPLKKERIFFMETEREVLKVVSIV